MHNIPIFLFVESNTRMQQIGTFLAIGPQIYVDGLVVMSEKDKGQSSRPVGRIGCKHIISNLLDSDYPAWLETKASQIMDNTVVALEMNSTLSSALEVFDKTRFAFAPIIANRDNERGSSSLVVTAVFAIRDIASSKTVTETTHSEHIPAIDYAKLFLEQAETQSAPHQKNVFVYR